MKQIIMLIILLYSNNMYTVCVGTTHIKACLERSDGDNFTVRKSVMHKDLQICWLIFLYILVINYVVNYKLSKLNLFLL